MFITGTQYNDTFANMIAYVTSIKDTLGATVFLPAGTYDGAGLEIPRNVSLYGQGYLTNVTGKPTLLTNISGMGGKIVENIRFSDGVTLENCRHVSMKTCAFNGNVDVIGTGSYYNAWYSCMWKNLDGDTALTAHTNSQNKHDLFGCSFYYETAGIDLRDVSGPYTNGWNIYGGSMEGEGASDAVLGPGFACNGRGHTIQGMWFERGGSRTFGSDKSIYLGADSKHCYVGINNMGYLVAVKDYGLQNKIEHLEMYMEPDVQSDHTIYQYNHLAGV